MVAQRGGRGGDDNGEGRQLERELGGLLGLSYASSEGEEVEARAGRTALGPWAAGAGVQQEDGRGRASIGIVWCVACERWASADVGRDGMRSRAGRARAFGTLHLAGIAGQVAPACCYGRA